MTREEEIKKLEARLRELYKPRFYFPVNIRGEKTKVVETEIYKFNNRPSVVFVSVVSTTRPQES